MMAQTGGQWTMASNRGPNAIGSSSNTYNPAAAASAPPPPPGNTGYNWSQNNAAASSGVTASSGGVGGSWGAAAPATTPSIASQARVAPSHSTVPSQPYGIASSSSTNMSGAGGTAVSDGSFEVSMIKELCPPGGMKAEPPPDKLARFSQAVSTLNADLICPALLDMLEEGNPWMMRAKALCVIETAITRGHSHVTNSNPYADFFYTCRGELEPLAHHTRAQVRQPARRCLDLLGVSTAAEAATAAAPTSAPPPAPVAPAADLLDFGSDEPVAAPAPPTMPPPAAPQPAGGLFGGLSVQGSTPAPPAPAAATGTNPAGFDALMAATAPQPAAIPQPAPAVRSDSLLDMAPAPSGGGLFDSMTIKGAAPAAPTEAPPPPPPDNDPAPPAGSAFSFMNSAAAAAPPEVPDYPPVQASPTIKTKPVFDPLLMPQQPNATTNPSPNTMKQMMSMPATSTLSPQQLQVMYAQQQMMMMSQQMQQMQLAMAMNAQQQKGGGAPVAGNPQIMQNNQSFAASTSFQFMDSSMTGNTKKKEKDAKFDFIQDAMKNEKK
mmetsp:Transcript_5802/g.8261  ORF Transcript_5802/g.8261 Transcript_5802/m.8261 type:complete len:549 (-) Transcript_5802:89-1735(-)